MLLTIRDLNTWISTESASGEVSITQILFNISLSIDHSQTVALVGESGSGKSVTALTILRLLEESNTVQNSGSIIYEDKDILSLSSKEIRKIRGNRIAMVFQEPMTSLNPVYSIGNQLIEPLLIHQNLDKSEARHEAIRLLKRTGIENPEERLHSFPHQLSGGQRQRAMIAMALACKPTLLIADEPTTALDVTIQAQILELIADIQKEYQMAILLITHDLAMVKQAADYIHIMSEGRIVEHGVTGKIFSSPQHSYTKHLLQAVPTGVAEIKTPSLPILQLHDLNCNFILKAGWKSLFKRQVQTIKAVNHVELNIERGTTCGIVGESGSGKTTLGMAILKLIKSSGSILFDNHPLHLLSNRQMRPLRKEIQIVFQDPYSSLSPRFTVEQIITEGMKIHGIGNSTAERSQLVRNILEEVGLEQNIAHRYPHEFSGGQRQRIAIARVLVLRPKFIILDEPTSALDMTIQAQVIDLLKNLQKKYNITYMFITHDLRVIKSLADSIVVMRHGKIIEAGPAREIFSSPRQEYTKALFSAALGTSEAYSAS